MEEQPKRNRDLAEGVPSEKYKKAGVDRALEAMEEGFQVEEKSGVRQAAVSSSNGKAELHLVDRGQEGPGSPQQGHVRGAVDGAGSWG